MLLSLVPEIHGRLDAGVSAMSSGHAPPTTTIAAPPASSWRAAAMRPRGATHSQAATIARTVERRRAARMDRGVLSDRHDGHQARLSRWEQREAGLGIA